MSKLGELNDVLYKLLPAISILNIPLSLVNIIVLLNLGILKSPSSFIYFNLVIMDSLNSITGLLISFDRHQNYWIKVGSNIYLFTFDANIFLIFGLAVVRVFCIRASALRVLQNLRVVSFVAVAVSWAAGGFAVLYPRIIKSNGYMKFAALDLVECTLIASTVIMSVYTLVAIRVSTPSLRDSTVIRSAVKTSFLITCNFICSYSYYCFLNGARLYLSLHEGDCPPDTWLEVFVCQDSLYVGVTCMCLQAVVNNTILLAQQHYRRFLLNSALMCVVGIRRKCSPQSENCPYN